MQKCITCGAALHPERAAKYAYCMSPECQEKNARGLTMVAVGVNKAAEQYMILDEQTKEDLATGKYHDQRRGSFGTSPAAALRSCRGSADAGTGSRRATAASPAEGPARSATGAQAVERQAAKARVALQRTRAQAG